MGDKIITPGTHVTHRKNIQPMNKSWYFYAFWLFFQQFSDCLRGCGVSIVYGKDPCLCQHCSVCDYKDTISEKRTKTPIKSSDFLLHPFSFLVLPLLGFVPQQWPSKSWDYISLSKPFKHSQKNSGFPSKTQFAAVTVACVCSGCSIRHRQALVTLSSRWKKLRILTFPNPVKLTPIRVYF